MFNQSPLFEIVNFKSCTNKISLPFLLFWYWKLEFYEKKKNLEFCLYNFSHLLSPHLEFPNFRNSISSERCVFLINKRGIKFASFVCPIFEETRAKNEKKNSEILADPPNFSKILNYWKSIFFKERKLIFFWQVEVRRNYV